MPDAALAASTPATSNAAPATFGDALMRLWPHGDAKIPGLRAAMIAQMPDIAARYGFDTPDVIAIFMGQISLECGAGLEVVENLNYTARRMMAVWPSRFPTLASAAPYANNPQKLANKVYNGRMGNRVGTDDGFTYRGRGATQTTGREAYGHLAEATGLDLLSNPDLVNDPAHFLESAAIDFIKCGCLPFAKRGDIEGTTHHLNGGLIGLSDRKAWTAKWRSALAVVLAPPANDNVLRLGSKGYEVKALQERLVELNYSVGEVDGKFGRGTRSAVRAFQDDRGLPCDGEVGPATREALKRDLTKPVAEKRATATAGDLRERGSETIARADKVSFVGKILAGTGLVTGGGHAAGKVGLLDTVRDGADQVSAFRGVFEQVHDLGGWALGVLQTWWWLALLIGGFFAIRYGGDIIRQRVEDHRRATNMGM
ncbi:MAG: peptidoglycan-binding protein [Rhizobiales bacterium]|nr:peptidoglycan-binding protein [Hyphomicrobiales bacterium]